MTLSITAKMKRKRLFPVIRRTKWRPGPKAFPFLALVVFFLSREDTIACEHRDFPPHWPRIGGMDFGWDHPFAAVELVWDRDTDTVYVSKTHRLKEATPVLHAAAINAMGQGIALGMAARRQTRNV